MDDGSRAARKDERKRRMKLMCEVRYYNAVAKFLIYFSSNMFHTGVERHMSILCARCLRPVPAKLLQAEVRQADPVLPAFRSHNNRSPINERTFCV